MTSLKTSGAPRIAVIGAGGFVGMRFLEMSLLGRCFEMVPVVRSPKSFARISKYGRPCAYADAGDPVALGKAISGCDAVVNLTMGDNARMVSDTGAILSACETAKVRVLVHVSSAEVFGRAEDPGLGDDSIPGPHWMAYAVAKAEAEALLRERLERSATSVVVVRPGLIWGPRSPWVIGPASDLLAGRAVLYGGGEGIANLVHVDNLIRMVVAVCQAGEPVRGFFNIGDAEVTQWKDYLPALAKEMGVSQPVIHSVPFEAYREGILHKLIAIKNAEFTRPIKKAIRNQTKWRIKLVLDRFAAAFGPTHSADAPPGPRIDRSGWWLQGTRHKLSTDKFRGAYPGVQLLTRQEGMRGTGEWLRFAGFRA
jgi:nucleoside-diphosphate-sugar epimerase